MGGESTLGVTEAVYSFGIAYIFICLGNAASRLIVAHFIAPRMNQFQNMISAGDIMYSFYGLPSKVITGLSGAIWCIARLGAQVLALGYLFNYFFGIPQEIGVFLSFGIVVIYSTFGGIRAVTLTDTLQFAIMIVAIPAVCNLGLVKIGGYESLIEALPKSHLRLFPEEGNPFKYIGFFLLFSFPFLDPTIIQRLLMAKDVKQMQQAMYATAFLDVLVYSMIGCIGLIAFILNNDILPSVAFPYLIQNTLPPGIKGIAIVGAVAAVMSTADSMLNTASVSLVHDVINPLKKKKLTGEKELLFARYMTVFIGLFAVAVAFGFDTIFEINFIAMNCWGPIIVIPLYAGLLGVKSNPRSFLLGGLTGISILVVWKTFSLENIIGIDNIIPSMLGNFIAYSISNHLSLRPPSRQHVLSSG